MSNIEIASFVLRLLALMVIYSFTGFGIGFVLGVVTGNIVFVRGKPNVMEDYAEAKRVAAQHNAQWDPSHERWKGAEAPGKTESAPAE